MRDCESRCEFIANQTKRNDVITMQNETYYVHRNTHERELKYANYYCEMSYDEFLKMCDELNAK